MASTLPHLYVESYAYKAGTRDGEDYTAEMYFVQAVYPNGDRYRHAHSFLGCKVEYCEEANESFFMDIRDEAKARADRLLARIQAAGNSIDVGGPHWAPAWPVYGSPAWEREQAEMTPRQLAGGEEWVA